MKSDRLIIIDDKNMNDTFSSFQAISILNEKQRSLIDYFETSNLLWKLNDSGDDVALLRDFTHYKFVFIHSSFNDPIVGEGVMINLINQLSISSNVVLFSGSRIKSETPIINKINEEYSESSHFEINRIQFVNNLANFVNSYIYIGDFKLKYLYNSSITPQRDKAYSLFEIIKSDLEESIQKAIYSKSFKELLSLYGYHNSIEISSRFATMTDDEFIETMENFIEKN